MNDIMRPATEWELKSMMAALAERAIPVEILGAGSKRGVGRPVIAPVALTTGAMRGISLYEPAELVMSARAGTPLSQIEVELASRGQMLPFEPIDLGPALGTGAGLQTIGAIFASNISGARRIAAGAARDFLLGVRGVNGRAEIFKSGGRVMKNVTGYDVARGLAGSWGTLAVLSEVTFKVLPLPDDVVTLVYPDLTEDLAVELMSLAMIQPYEVSGTAHLSPALVSRLKHKDLSGATTSLTAIRLENFTRSITYRKQKMREVLTAYGAPLELDLESSLEFWSEVRRLSFFPPNGTHIWRISTTPSEAPALVAAVRRHMHVEAFYDWSGGLVWLETPASADAGSADIRRAVATHGGHATLIRADDSVRRNVEVFQPLAPAIDRITRGIKQTFDPLRLLNPGRMYATM
ncbi:FAD-binding protein [Hyphomicrobium sp. CS1GBMeth3]|uniref:FAD-binding protein n=1 Tax=Hyphomicrobium sp. CS1GBMeth3 TaxID=1892845 RepID=UPI00093100F1|nr:FAD-binding protein [Hyphomicrobium sp. CS1GBMeth3]